jgi:anti-sigma regulatory factor (Ser/Thr protein kinase)
MPRAQSLALSDLLHPRFQKRRPGKAAQLASIQLTEGAHPMRNRWTHSFAAVPQSAPQIRALVTDLLHAAVPPDDLRQLMVGVGEAAANAVEHGRGPIHVVVELTACMATVTISDCGDGMDPGRLGAGSGTPSLDAESGRGLYIMSRVCDSVTVGRDHGCMVSIAKRFRPVEPMNGARPTS